MSNKISKITVKDIDYEVKDKKQIGANIITSLTSIPNTKEQVIAKLSGPTEFSLSAIEPGNFIEITCIPSSDFIQNISGDNIIKTFDHDIKMTTNNPVKLYVDCYNDGKIFLDMNGGEEFLNEFTIHISKINSDPAYMVAVDGLDSELLLSQFRRCLCKKVSDNNVKICFLNDNNSNQYHDGTTAKTDGTEGDVMVYFPEFWYLGTDTDDEWVMNISMKEKSGYNHAPVSLVGAYKAIASDTGNNTNGGLYSKSGADSSGSISMANFSTKARNRGAGYHLIDYQQHCIIAWMFYARYKNTNSQAICGTGKNAYSGINCGVTNSLGMNDTTAESASSTSNMLVNFLGLEGCWGYKYECIEGIHSYAGDGVIAYDKGDYHGRSFSSVQSPTKRILRTSSEGAIGQTPVYTKEIKGGEYMDMLPTKPFNNHDSYFCDLPSFDPSVTNTFDRSYYGAGYFGGITCLIDTLPANSGGGSRLAFDGNIEIVDNINTFKSLPVL